MTVLFILAILFLAVYVYAVLPHPFYVIRRGSMVMECDRPLWRRLLAALTQARPTLELTIPEFLRLVKLCPEPQRPLISWRGSKGYYDLKEKDDSSSLMPRAQFASWLHLLTLPLRVPLDHLLTPIVKGGIIVLYGLVVALGWAGFRLTLWRHRTFLATQKPDEVAAFDAQLNEYLDALAPESGHDAFPVLAEPGYFMFKLAEGRAFREAVSRFAGQRPNCEMGLDDGSISALHLAKLGRLDAGLNTSEWTLAPNALRYGIMRIGFIEDQPFPPETFAEIHLVHVTDHILDLDIAMASLVRMLRPGGRVFFSGLSHDFSGWWLEQACAAGCVWNNWDLGVYEELLARHGLELEWGRYCQPFPANLFWKATYGFAMKTRTWAILGRWLGATPGRRKWFRRFLRSLWRDLYRLEDRLLDRTGKGLNFMIVARLTDRPPS